MSVADSITSYEQITGDKLSPVSGLGPLRGHNGEEEYNDYDHDHGGDDNDGHDDDDDDADGHEDDDDDEFEKIFKYARFAVTLYELFFTVTMLVNFQLIYSS